MHAHGGIVGTLDAIAERMTVLSLSDWPRAANEQTTYPNPAGV